MQKFGKSNATFNYKRNPFYLSASARLRSVKSEGQESSYNVISNFLSLLLCLSTPQLKEETMSVHLKELKRLQP